MPKHCLTWTPIGQDPEPLALADLPARLMPDGDPTRATRQLALNLQRGLPAIQFDTLAGEQGELTCSDRGELDAQLAASADEHFTPVYEHWRHGGWYVTNVRHPSGAVGCVSRNYADGRWRIVCDPRPDAYPGGSGDVTYTTRDEAARAERQLIKDGHGHPAPADAR